MATNYSDKVNYSYPRADICNIKQKIKTQAGNSQRSASFQFLQVTQVISDFLIIITHDTEIHLLITPDTVSDIIFLK